jgi:uncharacterized protein YaeQ
MSFAVVMPLMMSTGIVLSLGLSLARRRVDSPAVWREKQKRRVSWIGNGAPEDEEVRAVWDAVVHRGLSTYGEITEHVAEQIFRQDSVRVGWLSDIGLFYPWYLSHACALLERLDGRLVLIDGSSERQP